jgi:meso-butanediol dehydrogenase/(S,S)-butanediol dehydrogenase/diacetyl reductase
MNIAPKRKALVTGGASGMGLEIARRLASDGVGVALVDVDAERLESAAAKVGALAVPIRADVRSPNDVKAAVTRAISELGGLDTVVISAGVIHIKPLTEVSEEDWDFTLDVNLKGAFLTCQAAASALVGSRRGRIVMISSDAGHRGWPTLQAYCASKFGLIGLAESLACELAPNVTVNCVCPIGVATTGMGQQVLSWKVHHTGRTPDQILAGVTRGVLLGRGATEADVADAVLFFISDSASFLTGVALDLDGGARFGGLPGAQ